MRKVLIWALVFVITLYVPVSSDGIQDALDEYYGDFGVGETYTDLDEVEWAKDAINYLGKRGLVDDDNGKVNPTRLISRKEFVELIIGAFGLYDFDAKCDFADVDKDSPYYPYIASAHSLGIINGVEANKFGMDEDLTRQDMATIIYRLAKKIELNMPQGVELKFVDAHQIDEYAYEAVSVLVAVHAISGDEANQFLPHNYSAYAEACKIVYYIIKNT